jgi:predicted Zn-dependent protease
MELAERALDHGSGDMQVTVTRERSLVSRFAHSAPTQATAVEDVDVDILSVRDGFTGSARTNKFDGGALRDAVARAVAAAKAAARGGRGDYPGLPVPAEARPHQGFDPETAELDLGRASASLTGAFEAAAERQAEAFGIWTAGAVETAIASSTGLTAYDAVTDGYMKVICRSRSGRTGFAAQTAQSAAALDGRTVALRAAAKLSGEELGMLEPGEYPVVLAPDAVGDLLTFLGDHALNGLAFAEDRSALSGRLGRRVASASVNLSDSPRHPRTLPRAFDAEGVPKSPLPLIEDGVFRKVVHDTRSAALAGAVSTGHALVPGGASQGPAPRNLVLTGGGAADDRELMASIERGLYVTRLWYVNMVRSKETLLTGMTRDGTFLIEGGELSRPLRDVRFTDSILRVLDATTALSMRSVLVGDGELYGRRFAYGVICPAIRAEAFKVTGATI